MNSKKMFRESLVEKFNYLCIDIARNKKNVNIVFSKKAKTLIANAFPKVKLFRFLLLYHFNNREDLEK